MMRRVFLPLILSLVILCFTQGPLGLGLGSQPDLTITKLLVLPPDPEPGDQVRIIVQVSNIGRGSVTQSFYFRLKLDDMVILRKRIARLRAGKTEEYQAQWKATAGRHRVVAEVDRPFSRIQEADERNNTATLELNVCFKGALYSLTDAVFQEIGTPLKRLGEMLHLTLSGDIFAALDAGVAQLAEAQVILEQYGLQLQYADYGLPSALTSSPEFTRGKEIGQAFVEMAMAVGLAADKLKTFDVNGAVTAMHQIKTQLDELAQLGFADLKLSPLAQAAVHVERAVQMALALQASLFGSNSSSGANSGSTGESAQKTDKLIQDFQKELAKAGDIIEGVGSQALSLPQTHGVKLVSLTSSASDPAERYRAGETLRVQALGPQALWLEFELYTATGELVYSTVASGGQLDYSGRDNSGRPLAPGRYFYRAVVHYINGTSDTEIGRIIVS